MFVKSMNEIFLICALILPTFWFCWFLFLSNLTNFQRKLSNPIEHNQTFCAFESINQPSDCCYVVSFTLKNASKIENEEEDENENTTNVYAHGITYVLSACVMRIELYTLAYYTRIHCDRTHWDRRGRENRTKQNRESRLLLCIFFHAWKFSLSCKQKKIDDERANKHTQQNILDDDEAIVIEWVGVSRGCHSHWPATTQKNKEKKREMHARLNTLNTCTQKAEKERKKKKAIKF